jgi:hypothetical protein
MTDVVLRDAEVRVDRPGALAVLLERAHVLAIDE